MTCRVVRRLNEGCSTRCVSGCADLFLLASASDIIINIIMYLLELLKTQETYPKQTRINATYETKVQLKSAG